MQARKPAHPAWGTLTQSRSPGAASSVGSFGSIQFSPEPSWAEAGTSLLCSAQSLWYRYGFLQDRPSQRDSSAGGNLHIASRCSQREQQQPPLAPPASVAAAAPSHHVVVLLEDHVLVVVEVEEVDGVEFVRHTAGAADTLTQLEGVDDGLHGGVVGWPHVLAQREGAGAFAVVGVVAPRRDDPPGPADLLEVHGQGVPLAGLEPVQ